MNKKLLSVTPKSQLFPIPMIMGCEGVSAAMLLQYNHHNIKATDIMKHWPTHPNNPYKGYVGHHLLVKFGHHQTIFPSAYVPYLQTFDSRIVDGTGTNLEELETVIDQGQPVLMYHTSLGQKPSRKTFKFDNQIISRYFSYLEKISFKMLPTTRRKHGILQGLCWNSCKR